MSKLLEKLNKEQKAAVVNTEGPLLILAGAGSGKTGVLTHRIAYIIEQRLAYGENILAVTFTNKAAGEMRDRVNKLLGGKIKVPWIGTFHSICIRILKRDGYHINLENNFSIYDEDDSISVIKQAIKNLKIDDKTNPKAVKGYISSAKNELVGPTEYENFAQGYFQEKVSDIYKEYQKLLRENNALDFDDIIMKTVELFKSTPKILEKYQELFRYILVDEYQDTNHAQYAFCNLLASKHTNICVVGDDDQSIYSWRGANIKNILSFEKDYSNAKIIKLEQNYRSTKKILEASHNIIKINKRRKDKKLWTENNDGDKITTYKAMDEKDEAFFVAENILKLYESGISYDKFAVLYRINAQSRVLEEIFLRSKIPYRIIGGVRFYDRKEIKDTLSFIKIIYNDSDNVSLKRIINIPARGVGPKSLSEIELMSNQMQSSIIEFILKNTPELPKGYKDFAKIYTDLLEASERMNIYDLIKFILDRTGYLRELEKDTEENMPRIENLNELLSIASDFTELSPSESLEAFLERVSLYEAQDDIKKDSDEKVTLMSIHAAKGLEYSHVFIIGLEEGIFPHSRAYTDPDEMEEERRLAYVAVTRAKEKLFMTYTNSRRFFGSIQTNPVSRFVEDIDENLIENKSYSSNFSNEADYDNGFTEVDDEETTYLELEKGMRVKHPTFGIGRVIDLDESYVKIDFGNLIGTKELALSFAKLEPL